MGPKKLPKSPVQKAAGGVKKKYDRGRRMTPDRKEKVRRALYSVSEKHMSLRQAAKEYGLSYGFLHRRHSSGMDISQVKGPDTVFTEEEEENMALWLSEMAQRGMGLRMCEFLDFVQNIVKKEKRKTPFKDGRPGKSWYRAFTNRTRHIIGMRTEVPLELKRAKLTKQVTDKWYGKFRDFLSRLGCLEKPKQIWNCDESGFNMGYNKSKVIGPANRKILTPQISSGKRRLTVMFCGNAAGEMMPPFFVYPAPRPKGYNPLTGAIEGSEIGYTKKGWMDACTFDKFIAHFDKHAGRERPVVLLLDSVSSHVSHSVFMSAVEKGIEVYRIVPNATHLMQPLDKGVFGPLKAKWHLVARKYARENPGKIINKENFAEKLKEAFMLFYKPLTVINAFKASGVYPVDSSVITTEILKPGLTFSNPETTTINPVHAPESYIVPARELEYREKARGALEVFSETLSTPVREKYQKRIEEKYDIEGQSPCFDVFKKLHKKVHASKDEQPSTSEITSPLDILAEVALQDQSFEEPSTSLGISPVLKEALVYPAAQEAESDRPPRQTLLTTLPHHLTSSDSIRTLSLKELEKIKKIAEKEKKAKNACLKRQKAAEAKSSVGGKKGKSKINPTKGKGIVKKKSKDEPRVATGEEYCKGCSITWQEDLEANVEKTWVQCDECDGWMHAECLSQVIDDNEPFCCPDCS